LAASRDWQETLSTNDADVLFARFSALLSQASKQPKSFVVPIVSFETGCDSLESTTASLLEEHLEAASKLFDLLLASTDDSSPETTERGSGTLLEITRELSLEESESDEVEFMLELSPDFSTG